LTRLEQSGLVERRSHGNRAYYRAAVSHPAFPDMRGLVAKTLGVDDVVRRALRSLEAGIDAAFIYGSFAAGDPAAGSDVDLFVVGTVSRRELAVALHDAAAELARQVDPVIIRPAELAKRLRDAEHFVSAVLAGPRIWLIGDDATLAALA
jgi:predicted nucleotidyltransferase